jgi:hypothetical protein
MLQFGAVVVGISIKFKTVEDYAQIVRVHLKKLLEQLVDGLEHSLGQMCRTFAIPSRELIQSLNITNITL